MNGAPECPAFVQLIDGMALARLQAVNNYFQKVLTHNRLCGKLAPWNWNCYPMGKWVWGIFHSDN